jgi:hypothetical protein
VTLEKVLQIVAESNSLEEVRARVHEVVEAYEAAAREALIQSIEEEFERLMRADRDRFKDELVKVFERFADEDV